MHNKYFSEDRLYDYQYDLINSINSAQVLVNYIIDA